MANQKPLVVINGQVQQLPDGDTLAAQAATLGATSVSTLGVSGQTTYSNSNNAVLRVNTGATTGYVISDYVSNYGGSLDIGLANSAGVFLGNSPAGAYAAIFGTTNATGVALGTNNLQRLWIDGTTGQTNIVYGLAVTGAISTTGQVSSTIATGTPPLAVISTTPVANLSIGGTAAKLAGGTGGSIPYQSAADTTVMLGNGIAGQVLQSNGTTLAPSWVTPATAGMWATIVTTLNAGVWEPAFTVLGDILMAGTTTGVPYLEPVSSYNSGNPQLLFTTTGDSIARARF